MPSKNKKTCSKGHVFYKTSDCPVCPICEKSQPVDDGFLSMLSAPARRALTNKGINTALQLSTYTKQEILALHGMGPASIPVLQEELKKRSLSFHVTG